MLNPKTSTIRGSVVPLEVHSYTYLMNFFHDFFLLRIKTYPLDCPDRFSDLKELGKYYPNISSDQIISLVDLVDHFTWGDFLNSPLFSKWLQRLISGDTTETDTDVISASHLCTKLPGLHADADGYTSYHWTALEASHPGRFLHMRSLKQKVMMVSYTPPGNFEKLQK